MAGKQKRNVEYRRPRGRKGNLFLELIIVLLLLVLIVFFVFSRVLGGRAEITDGGIQIILPERQEEASVTPPLILDEEPEESVLPEEQPEDFPLPSEFPQVLCFSSGVGAWQTSLKLERDGTFTGMYMDTDLGTIGEGYPNGTRYICNFSGRFESIEQVDPYCFVLTLTELVSDYEEGKAWIEDGIRFVSSVPYGLEEGTDFHLYRPETPTEGLPEELLQWRQIGGEPLGLFCLYNVTMAYAFFG